MQDGDHTTDEPDSFQEQTRSEGVSKDHEGDNNITTHPTGVVCVLACGTDSMHSALHVIASSTRPSTRSDSSSNSAQHVVGTALIQCLI